MDSGQTQSLGPHEPITGWLLVLCLVLTVIQPGSIVYSYWFTLSRLVDAQNRTQALLLSVYIMLFGALAAFSFVAGVKLWTVAPGAVKFARAFLLTYLITHFVFFLFWFLVCRPAKVTSIAAAAWTHIVGPLLPFALWSGYLEHSKRVRRTYSDCSR